MTSSTRCRFATALHRPNGLLIPMFDHVLVLDELAVGVSAVLTRPRLAVRGRYVGKYWVDRPERTGHKAIKTSGLRHLGADYLGRDRCADTMHVACTSLDLLRSCGSVLLTAADGSKSSRPLSTTPPRPAGWAAYRAACFFAPYLLSLGALRYAGGVK